MGSRAPADRGHLHSQFYLILKDRSSSVEDKLEALISSGFDIHHVYNDQTTALHMASEFGNDELVRVLLRYPRTRDDILAAERFYSNTALHLAAIGGNARLLQALLGELKVVSVDFINKHRQTPLHFAMGKGRTEVARQLIELGADIHFGDRTGATPLHFAARGGAVELLKEVHERTSWDVNECSKAGLTALHYAAWNRKVETVEWLLDAGADLTRRDKVEKAMPLHWAAMREGNKTTLTRLVEAHIRRGISVYERNETGQSMFDLVEERGHDQVTAVLNIVVDEGLLDPLAFPELVLARFVVSFGNAGMNQKLASSLQYAAEKGDRERVVNLLHSCSLSWAAEKGNRDCVNALSKLVKEFLPRDFASQVKEALQVALFRGQEKFASALVMSEYCRDRIPDWIMGVKALLTTDKPQDDYRSTKPVKKVIQAVPSDELNNIPVKEDIPLAFWIFEGERQDIADFIKHNKAWSKIVNEQGMYTKRTALHWAAILQKKDIVTKLCNIKECRTNLQDAYGKSPYWYAVEQGREDIQKELTGREDVRAYLDILYRDRQVFVDALNAILVGAALIASITFGGFLQPPLSYPVKFPPGKESPYSYVAVQKGGVKAFWIFNSLSFFFAIASALAGARGVLPMPEIYIQEVVIRIRKALLAASTMLVLSIACVLLSFGAAGFSVLPPAISYDRDLIITSSVGGALCLAMLVWFVRGLHLLLPCKLLAWGKHSVLAVPKLATHMAHTVCCIRDAPPCDEAPPPEPDQLPQSSTCSSARSVIKYEVGPNYSEYPWDDGLDVLCDCDSEEEASR